MAAAPAAAPLAEMKTPKLVIGLDWSMHSPAAAARLYSAEGTLQQTWLMCFQQRRATPQAQVTTVTPLIELTEYPMYDIIEQKGRWAVLAHHCHCLQLWVGSVRYGGTMPNNLEVQVFIEDYAFGVRKSASFTKLAEDAGCALHTLFRLLNVEATPVNICKVKKMWTGSGAADKLLMYHGWLKRGLPELRDTLRCAPGDNPYSDVVDALAVLETGRATLLAK